MMRLTKWKLVFLTMLFGAVSVSAAETFIDQDVVVPASEISGAAKFYQTVVNGAPFEILIVKAPDGTIRTAINTCQACYDSGRAYFVQNGSVLVCQNCKRQFRLGQVGKSAGGCNPVPIAAGDRRDADGNIVIPREYLATQTQWKTFRN